MDKNVLNINLIKISAQLTHEQTTVARENRDWDKFDELDEIGKLMHRLEEFEMYQDIIDENYEIDFSL